jgi:hypothetical protein
MVILAVQTSATEYHGDVSLSGNITDQLIDVWGNVTIPAGERLELKNTSLTFRSDSGEDRYLHCGVGSSLVVVDGDGDPDTDDGSLVTSWNCRWFAVGDDMDSVVIGRSVVEGLGDDWDPRNPSDPTSLKVSGSLDIFNTTFRDMRGIFFLRSLETLTIHGSSFGGNYSQLEIFGTNLLVERSDFDGVNYSLIANAKSPLVIEDCTFSSRSGTGLWTQGDILVNNSTFIRCVTGVNFQGDQFTAKVEGCEFIDCYYGVAAYKTMRLIVNDSRFEGGDRGIQVSSGIDYEFTNLTFDGLLIGAYIRRHSSLTIRECKVVDSGIGFHIESDIGREIISHCSFENISDTAIKITVRPPNMQSCMVDNCTFLNTTIGIDSSYIEWDRNDHNSPVLVWDSTFRDFRIGIKIKTNTLYLLNGTFVGNYPKTNGSIGVRSDTSYQRIIGFGRVEDTTFRSCWYGISVTARYELNPHWSILNTTVMDCSIGMIFRNLTSSTFEHTYVDRCEMGILIEDSKFLTVLSVTVRDSLNGLLVRNSGDFTMYHLGDDGGNGLLIEEENVPMSLWEIQEDTSYAGCSIKLGGLINVSANLSFDDVILSMVGGGSSPNDILVNSGGWFVLESSTIFGDTNNQYSLKVLKGAAIELRNSTVRRCGQPTAPIDEQGPFAVGAEVTIEGTEIRECYRGFTLIDSTLEMKDSQVQAYNFGIYSESSILSIRSSTLKSDITAMYASDSSVLMEGTRCEGVIDPVVAYRSTVHATSSIVIGDSNGLLLEASKAFLTDVDFRAKSLMMRFLSSEVYINESTLSSTTYLAEVNDGSYVRLYNTTWAGSWKVTGNGSILERYWPQRVTAHYLWSGDPLVNASLGIYPTATSFENKSVDLGDDGDTGPFWLLGSRKTQNGSARPGPYVISYSSPGLYGEVITDPRGPWSGRIQVADISPPTIEIWTPVNGTITRYSLVYISGNFSEVGSGRAILQLRTEGTSWVDIEPDQGRWSVGMPLPDGLIIIEARVSDIAGNEANATTWLMVDTIVPTLIIEGPMDDTVTRNASIRVTGQVLAVGPSGLEKVTLNEELIDLVDGKHIDIVVPLDDEGSNIIVIAVWDKANNTDYVAIVVHRDTTIPDLTLDAQANVTNDPIMTVSGFCEDPNGADITVDGVMIGYIHNIRFAYDVNLTEGPNSVVVVATDVMGNSVTKTIHIVLDTIIEYEVLSPLPNMELNSTNLTLLITLEENAEVRAEGLFSWTAPGPNGTVEMVLVIPQGEDFDVLLEFRDDLGNLDTAELALVWEPGEDDDDGEIDLFWMLALLIVAAAVLLSALAYLRLRQVKEK